MWRAKLIAGKSVQSRVSSAVDEVWRTEAGSDASCSQTES